MAKIIVQFSGGKDSQATLIWAVKKFGNKNIEAVFCDTGWEHEETYKHIEEICQQMEVKLVTINSKKFPTGMVEMSKAKKRFPSTKNRFCTQELKIFPFIDYVLEQNENLLIFQGIRNDESESRSLMTENCELFKYYFQPYVNNSMIVSQLKEKKNLTFQQKNKLQKAIERLEKGKEDAKFSTYRKKEVIEWKAKFDDSIWRPIIKWKDWEVIDFILGNNQKVNPLYYRGSKRVGCYPCIMSNHQEMKQMIKLSPEFIEKVRQSEKLINSSFFPPNYIPKRFCSQVSENGKKFPTIDDVVNYLTEYSGNIFEEQEQGVRKCMSFYSICE